MQCINNISQGHGPFSAFLRHRKMESEKNRYKVSGANGQNTIIFSQSASLVLEKVMYLFARKATIV